MIEWKEYLKHNSNIPIKHHTKGKKKPIEVCDNIFCFDIEVSSYFIDAANKVLTYKEIEANSTFKKIKDKRERYNAIQDYITRLTKGSVCYIWQFSIDDKRVFGRSLDEFKTFLDIICDAVDMPFICLIHNASYEYQFCRGLFGDNNIEAFYTEARKPLYFKYRNCEFRCTYRLTNSSLAQWGDKIHLEKLDTLDYMELYTPTSELPEKALEYAERDIEIMYKGIQEYITEYGNIWNVPYTQTGRVRKERKAIYHNNYNYHRKMTDMIPEDHNEYKTLRCCCMGGMCFTGVENANRMLYNVGSYDRASAYPLQMVLKEFPSGRFRECYSDDIDFENYHYIFYARIYNAKAKTSICCIPASKMWNRHGTFKFNNGKLLEAEGEFEMFFTEIDMQIYNMFYDYEIKYIKTWVSLSSLLDIDFVKYILKQYGIKTKLKNVEGREAEYMRGKEMLNAIFGETIMRIVFSETKLEDNVFTEVYKNDEETDEELNRLKSMMWKNDKAFSTGVYVTAYQRYDLLKMAYKIRPEHFCYTDTDSLKMLFPELYAAIFEEENKIIENDLRELAAHRGLDYDLFAPEDINGNKHLIGLWEFEGIYTRAKFDGAKRYAYEQVVKGKTKRNIVVAGVPKTATNHVTLDDFDDGFIFTPEDMEYKKNILVYLDGNNPDIVLNKGRPDEWHVTDKYGICMYPTGYDMSLTNEYRNLIDLYNNRKGNIHI